MDKTTTAIGLEKWANVFRKWSTSGLTKTEFCRKHGIKAKLFFYYQGRIQPLIQERPSTE